MLVPHGALILVADEAHAQLFRNRGRDTAVELEPVAVDQPSPERRLSRYHEEQHHARALADDRRAHALVAAVGPILASGAPVAVILIAPPHLLGSLRQAFAGAGHCEFIAELAKDLAACPPTEIAERLHLMST